MKNIILSIRINSTMNNLNLLNKLWYIFTPLNKYPNFLYADRRLYRGVLQIVFENLRTKANFIFFMCEIILTLTIVSCFAFLDR